jgi:pyruvate ferredoxin oxidoreductase alpha subunit
MLTISTGNNAVAAAVREAKPAVVAAYPITPQTEIVEQIANFVTNGSLKSSYIPVESEHSAMAACIGASITGVRTFTATSSHGLLYMQEMVNWAAGARLPIVMANVNRALGPGWNVWAEHTDSLQSAIPDGFRSMLRLCRKLMMQRSWRFALLRTAGYICRSW